METGAATFGALQSSFMDRPGCFVPRSQAVRFETAQVRADCEQFVEIEECGPV
jgi:hypothetical protein